MTEEKVTSQRFLRPGLLAVIDDALWAIDETQPVAAVLDPDTMSVRQLVDWRAAEPSGVDNQTMMAVDGTSLWLQMNADLSASGPLVRADVHGAEQLACPDGALLMAAGRGAAWLVIPEGRVEPRYPTEEGEYLPTSSMPGCQLIVIDSAGQRTIPVDRLINRIVSASSGVFLEVHGEFPKAVRVRETTAWQYEYQREWLVLPDPLPERVEYARCAAGAPTEQAMRAGFVGYDPMLSWHRTFEVTSRGLSAAGLRWALGPVHEQANGDRHRMIATGHDPGTGEERRRFELGYGRLQAATATGNFLWALCCRAPRPRIDRPLELVRLDASSGATETVGPIDITELCRPLVHLSEAEIAEHASRELRSAANLDKLECLRDVRCAVEGNWPRMYLRVWFRNSYFPEGLLTRRWALFDEFGRPTSGHHDGVFLMEDVECRLLPPVDTAVDGVLEV